MTAKHSFSPRAWLLAAAALAALGSAVAQTNDTSGIKPAEISPTPLYAAMAGDRPTMLLAPSVEFPTVGLLHNAGGTAADVYSPANAYLGYFNHEMCYEYNKGERYFEISKRASGRKCSGDEEFSGNFLNWATASAIDMMRLALTGGDRVIDEPGRTVLQRAYIPEGKTGVKSVQLMNGKTKTASRGGQCFWKHTSYFYTKVLEKGDDGKYSGAIPKDMIEALDEQDALRPVNAGNAAQDARGKLFVANIGNQIRFGVHRMDGINYNAEKRTDQCDFGPYNYVLGAGGKVNEFHSTRRNAFFGTSEHDQCAHGTQCDAGDKPRRIWYGSNVNGQRWITGIVKGEYTCGTFGAVDNTHGDTAETKHNEKGYNATRKCYLEDEDAILTHPEDDFFVARVKVCDEKDERDYKDNNDADFGYCREYPNGKKKPVGVIQKYADNLRIAAFGYLMDHTAAHGDDNYEGRFGAALRAPMKYVGPNTYSPTGRHLSSDNPRKEWDTETGVLIENPEGREEGVSGVINYFNRFGRNPTALGNYKQYDNVGEMYYEALRYLQGLPRTEEAVKYLTDYKKDGFPVYTSWDGLDPFDSELGYSPTADYTCVNNSLLIIGDINTHDPVNSAGAKDKLRYTMAGKDTSKNEFDIAHWRDVVLGYEIPQHVNYVDGAGENITTSNPLGGNTPSSIGDGTEAWRNWNSFIPGMAYWAHTHDIRGKNWTNVGEGETAYQEKDENGTVTKSYNSKVRPGLRVTSYFFDVNEAGMMHSYDARRGTKVDDRYGSYWGNQYWLGAKYGGFLTEPASSGSVNYNTHGNPYYDSSGAIASPHHIIWSDLTKAQGANTDGAANPEPRTYYMPADAEGVLKAFDAIFGNQKPPSNRSIGGADSSGGLQGTSYQALFDGEAWGGDVLAERFRDSQGNATNETAWSANDTLVRELASGRKVRNIIMGERTSSGGTDAFNFTAADTPDDVKEALRVEGDKGDLANDRIAWLRGDRSKETANNGPFRTRETYLIGDIINSGVKYVGPPAGATNLGDAYVNYVENTARRTSAVYVGANDGMLHAFHAGSKTVRQDGTVVDEPGTGSELFAYIPSWMKDKLAALTDPKYVHQLYVDATPVIGDAKLNTKAGADASAADWATVLVGGTGGGGKGVFALNVTDPTRFTKDSVLWEFTDEDDPDMGYVLGQARIVKLYTGDVEDNSTTPPTTRKVYRWFAMVPAGVNNYAEDASTRTSGNGNANIFLLALDKAKTASWEQNSNYWKIELPRIEALEAEYPTGILNLEAFTGVGSVTEYVYAGDLHGQLWALAFKNTPTSGWTAATLANNYVNGSKIAPLFVAKNKDGNPQPITVAPTILEGASNGVHFVSFGTGKYFEPDDSWVNRQDTFYTVYSNFNSTAAQLVSRGRGPGANPPVIPGRDWLQEVTKDTESSTADTTYFNATAPFYWGWIESSTTQGTRSGWFHDFDEAAEREVADASWISQTSRLMFSTLTPGASNETGVCGTQGGTSRLYTFDMISGKGFRKVSTIGMLAQPLVFFDDPEETRADSTGRRLRISPVFSGQFGSAGSKAEQVDTVVVPFGRLSWRRIDNFQELRKNN